MNNRTSEIIKEIVVQKHNYDFYEQKVQEADNEIAALEDELYELENYEV